jgi:Berberine and berberine like
MIIVMPFCDTANEAEAKERFTEFFALGPVLDNTKIHSYVEQNMVISGILPHGPRSYMKGFGYSDMSAELLHHAFGAFSSYISHIREDYEISAIAFEAYPTEKICSVPSESTAYPSRGKHLNCVISARWKTSSLDDWVKEWVKAFTQEARAIDRKAAIEQGKKPVGNIGYANVSLPEDRTVEWFGENFAKLKEVKKKWDPEQRFNKWFPVSPA